jgi:hypothetical protein
MRLLVMFWMIPDLINNGVGGSFAGANFVDGSKEREFLSQIVLIQSLIEFGGSGRTLSTLTIQELLFQFGNGLN